MEHNLTLDEISVKNSTDQGSGGHCYLGLFELLFRPWKGKPVRLLEIGIQWGNSLKTWRDYLGPDAKIVGIDIVDNQIGDLSPTLLIYGDAYNEQMLERLGHDQFEIIVDDDSHFPITQVWFLQHYSKLLAPDGIMIVEDVPDRATIELLKAALPEEFDYTAIEMVEGHALVDSRAFICWRK